MSHGRESRLSLLNHPILYQYWVGENLACASPVVDITFTQGNAGRLVVTTPSSCRSTGCPRTSKMEEQLLARIRRSQQLLRMPLHPLPTPAGGGPQLQRPRPAPRAELLTMEAHLLLARCMRQWRRALAERQHVERGRRMERLLKTLTVRENQSRGHVVAEATTESPLQPTPEPLPRSEADCPDSPKQHTPPTPLPQPRRATLAANGGGYGGAVRLGEPALLDASGRPARRGGRCEARRGGGG